MIDIILDGMRTDTAHRKEDFYKNKRDMVNLTAYFGELLAKSEGLPGRWIWRELHEGSPRFVIEAHSYDPLERLIAAWNFGQESFVYSIGRFPIATPSEDEEDTGTVHSS